MAYVGVGGMYSALLTLMSVDVVERIPCSGEMVTERILSALLALSLCPNTVAIADTGSYRPSSSIAEPVEIERFFHPPGKNPDTVLFPGP
jgi:hypothetical protein